MGQHAYTMLESDILHVNLLWLTTVLPEAQISWDAYTGVTHSTCTRQPLLITRALPVAICTHHSHHGPSVCRSPGLEAKFMLFLHEQRGRLFASEHAVEGSLRIATLLHWMASWWKSSVSREAHHVRTCRAESDVQQSTRCGRGRQFGFTS